MNNNKEQILKQIRQISEISNGVKYDFPKANINRSSKLLMDEIINMSIESDANFPSYKSTAGIKLPDINSFMYPEMKTEASIVKNNSRLSFIS